MQFFKRELKNGITVLFEKRELPIVSISITNKFGAAFEKSEIKGIAHFMEHLVFTGTKTRTHEDISREIEKKGGILNAFTSHEVTSFWCKLPNKHLFAGFEVLSDMLKNPAFDAEKFEKEKKVILEEIKMYHDMPTRDVFDKIEANLYGKPFGESVIGSDKSISALKRDFVAKYFFENYNPANFIVCVVGDADFEEVCNYLEKKFEMKKGASKIIPIVMQNKKSVEEREGIDQAHFMLACHAPLLGTNEYNALEVLDGYLANGMSSRLFLEIREKRGLAYAVKSSVDAMKDYSYYGIYVGTTKEALAEVEKIILREIELVGEMNEKQLQEAKEQIIGLKNVASEESVNVMNELVFAEATGKAEDYYKYEEKINSVELEDVKKLAINLIKNGYSTVAIVPK
ncbi:MAG: pitrilysin family protein [Nanoarchaeota archaeon]